MADPQTIALVAVGLVPSLAWLIFYLRQDLHPEPRRALMVAFFLGALATIPALVGELAVVDLVAKLGERGWLAALLGFASLGAIIEELFKCAAALIFCRRKQLVDEAVDPMLYSVVIALGFAGLENIFSLLRPPLSLFPAAVPQFLLVRFLSGTFLHALAGGVFGFGLAHWLFGHRNRAWWLAGSFALAVGLHALWNAAILIERIPFVLLLIPLLLVGFIVLWDFATLRMASIRRAQDIG